MILFCLLPLIIFSLSYGREVSVVLDDPTKSPEVFTVEKGYGLAMDEWPDAIVSISYGDVTKRLTYRDQYFLFIFDQATTVSITYYHRVLFHIFKIPTSKISSMSPELHFSTYYPARVYSTTEPTKIDYYATAFGEYNVTATFLTTNTITVSYTEGGISKTKEYKTGDDMTFKSTNPIEKTFSVTGNGQFHLHGITIYVLTEFEPTIKGEIAVSLPFTTQEKNRAYRDKNRNPSDHYSNIKDIIPYQIPSLKLNLSPLENEGYSFKYCLTENCTDYTRINDVLSLEFAIAYDVNMLVSSPQYPQCKDAKMKAHLHFSNSDSPQDLEKESLPKECLPPKAELKVINNISYYATVSVNVSFGSYQSFTRGQIFTKAADTDFTCLIKVSVPDYCNLEHYKTINVKVGDSIEIIVDDDDVPPMCRKSNIKTMCYCEEDNYEKCAEGVEGRVFVNYKNNNFYNKVDDPGENVSIRVFRNLTIDSTWINNKHNITVSPDHILTIERIETINQTDDMQLIVDNLTVDLERINNVRLKSYQLTIIPPTNVTFVPIIIEINNLVLRVPEECIPNSLFSPLKFIGYGIIKVHDYPIDKMEFGDEITVVEGIYVICNPKAGDSICPTKEFKDYKILKQSATLSLSEIAPGKMVFIFYETLNEIININIKQLNNQSFSFESNPTQSKILSDDNFKIRILSTEQLIHNHSTLSVGDDQVRFSIYDTKNYNKFIFSYDNVLTLKQGDSINTNSNPILLEPTKDKSVIYFDDSFTSISQEFSVRSPNNKINIYLGDKEFSKYDIGYFFRCNESSCSQDDIRLFEGKPPDSIDDVPSDDSGGKNNNKNGGGVGPGVIAGIVVAVIVIVAAVVVGVVFYLKKKKEKEEKSEKEAEEI